MGEGIEESMIEHTKYVCTRQECYPCQFCDGGLFACTICGGFEGTLTTECPGRKLTPDEERLIYTEGKLDFRNGAWVEAPNYSRSAFYAEPDKSPEVIAAMERLPANLGYVVGDGPTPMHDPHGVSV